MHGVLDPAALRVANAMLVAFTASHVAASLALVSMGGALGLVAADSINMLLRIAYSLRCVALCCCKRTCAGLSQPCAHPANGGDC